MEQSSVTTSNGLTQTYNVLPTKQEILQRLLKEEKITVEELFVLVQETENVRYVYIPQPFAIQPPPVSPYNPYPYNPYPQLPWTITCSTNSKQDDNK